VWKEKGEHGEKDPSGGLTLILEAADKNHGPALYEIAMRRIEGRFLPSDVQKGLDEMDQAALLGSSQAQLYIGDRYERGDGVPRDLDRACRDFRLCAVQGIAECQYRLGKLLFDAAGRLERDYIQAIALFQLAGEQGHPEAREIAAREAANLTPAQGKWVNTLKTQLVRK
jgi:TPR repeat protein